MLVLLNENTISPCCWSTICKILQPMEAKASAQCFADQKPRKIDQLHAIDIIKLISLSNNRKKYLIVIIRRRIWIFLNQMDSYSGLLWIRHNSKYSSFFLSYFMQVSAMVFACVFHACRAKLLGAIFLHTVKFLVPKFVTVAAQQQEWEGGGGWAEGGDFSRFMYWDKIDLRMES